MHALAVETAIPRIPAPRRGRELLLDVETRLRTSGYFVLRAISCDAQDGVLSLDGRLPSHYLKQVAQSLAYEAEGVRYVVNRIEVIAPRRIHPAGHDQATAHSDGVN